MLEDKEQQENEVKSGLLEAESSFKEQLNALQMHPAFRKFLASEKRLIQSEQLLHSIEQYIQTQRENQDIGPILKDIRQEFLSLNQNNKTF